MRDYGLHRAPRRLRTIMSVLRPKGYRLIERGRKGFTRIFVEHQCCVLVRFGGARDSEVVWKDANIEVIKEQAMQAHGYCNPSCSCPLVSERSTEWTAIIFYRRVRQSVPCSAVVCRALSCSRVHLNCVCIDCESTSKGTLSAVVSASVFALLPARS